jgi:hypothetical protein
LARNRHPAALAPDETPGLTLHDAERCELGDATGEAGALDVVDDALDVLVGGSPPEQTLDRALSSPPPG